MKRHVFNAVQEMKDKLVFSMPGHKSKKVFDFDYMNDITETIGTDNLLNPHGCILESQKEVSKVYGVVRSYYIANGSTSANHIALGAVTKPKDHVLVQRNCHKSVYNGMVLNDLVPKYINANYNKKYNLITGIEPEDIKAAFEEDPLIKAVVVVSPNFFGVCLKLKEIAEIVHEYGAYLIVDEAHAPHLAFSELSEYSAVNCGADLIIHSTHKTVPSLTQSALLHVNNEDISHRKIIERMNLTVSTSPSYLLTQSSEFAVDYMDRIGRDRLVRNSELIEQMKKNLEGKVTFFNGDDEDNTFEAVDNTKILLSIGGMTGFDIVKSLFLRYNIRLEMGDLYYALGLSSAVDEPEDFEKLENALRGLASEEVDKKEFSGIKLIEPKIMMNPRDAYYADREIVDFKDSVGRVSAAIVAAYPPGIPIVSFGEIITKEIVDEVLNYQASGIEVVGIYDDKVEVVL